MNATTPFKQPDEMTILVAMVLQQIDSVLKKQKSTIAVIPAPSTNDYYWAMFDPRDEQQWLDEDYGDIREMPLFDNRIADDQRKAFEFLKDRGVIKRLKVNQTSEDPENMGWKDYFVINSFEVEVNLTKFLKYHDTYRKAAQPALRHFQILSGQQPVDDSKLSQSESNNTSQLQPAIRPKKITLHPLQPKHYSDRTGVLTLNTTTDVILGNKRGRTIRSDGKPYLQCKLTGMIFKNVKTIKSGILFSTFYGVHDRYIDKKMEKRIRNTVSEINKKVAEVGGPKNLIYVQDRKIHLNHSYL